MFEAENSNEVSVQFDSFSKKDVGFYLQVLAEMTLSRSPKGDCRFSDPDYTF